MGRPGLMLHRKLRRLARELDGMQLGFGAVLARGSLELLWDGAYEAGDAYLGDAMDVEARAGWAGQSGVLCEALRNAGGPGHAGFIEEGGSTWWPEGAIGTYRVHDLFDHAPDYVAGRQRRETERKRDKACAHCGASYRSPDPRSRYHSEACRKAAWRGRHPPGDASGTDGDGGLRSRDGRETDRDGTPAPAPAPHIQEARRAASAPPLPLLAGAPQPEEPRRKRTKKVEDTGNPPVEPLRLRLIEIIRATGATYLDTSIVVERTNLRRALLAGATPAAIENAFRQVYARGGWNPRIQDVARVLTSASERPARRNGADGPPVPELRELTGFTDGGEAIYAGGKP